MTLGVHPLVYSNTTSHPCVQSTVHGTVQVPCDTGHKGMTSQVHPCSRPYTLSCHRTLGVSSGRTYVVAPLVCNFFEAGFVAIFVLHNNGCHCVHMVWGRLNQPYQTDPASPFKMFWPDVLHMTHFTSGNISYEVEEIQNFKSTLQDTRHSAKSHTFLEVWDVHVSRTVASHTGATTRHNTVF